MSALELGHQGFQVGVPPCSRQDLQAHTHSEFSDTPLVPNRSLVRNRFLNPDLPLVSMRKDLRFLCNTRFAFTMLGFI